MIAGLQGLSETGDLVGISSVYETAPEGLLEQRSFLNMVVEMETALHVDPLLDRLHAVEDARGRQRRVANGPRTLDLDLLLYDNLQLQEGRVRVPHPRMVRRFFVLVPLLELDPEIEEPGTGHRYADSLAALEREDPSARPRAIRRIYGGHEIWPRTDD